MIKPEWIEVGDIIYFDDRIITPKVVLGKIQDPDFPRVEKWALGDEIDGDIICEMMYFKDLYWIGDDGWNIKLFKQIDQNWIRDLKINQIVS
jgi:hypothetical protein